MSLATPTPLLNSREPVHPFLLFIYSNLQAHVLYKSQRKIHFSCNKSV